MLSYSSKAFCIKWMANTRAQHMPFQSVRLSSSPPVYILAHVWANMAYTQCQTFIRARFVANLKIETRFDIVQFLFYCIILLFYLTLFALFFYANTFQFCTAWQGPAIEIEIALFKNECNSRKKINLSLTLKIAPQKPTKL